MNFRTKQNGERDSPLEFKALKKYYISLYFKLPGRIALHKRLVVRQRVVIQEQTRGYVERDEHVDGIMLVGGQDEEYTEHVHDPRQDVEEVQASRCVCRQNITF